MGRKRSGKGYEVRMGKKSAGLRNGQRFRKKCDSLDHISDAKIFSREGA